MPKLPQGLAEPSFLLGAAMVFGFGAPMPRLVRPSEFASPQADLDAIASDVAAVGKDFADVIAAEPPSTKKSE